MSKPEFVYVSYIRTTPELLYRALTERAFMERYWGVVVESDWQVGSTITWEKHGLRQSDPRQLVLEADPPHRLSYTWHAITPEWSPSLSEERCRRAAAEPLSQVTFELERHGELVKLTVRHDHLEPDGVVAQMVSKGWPMVISSLKSLLETGDTQPATA
ncbi:MAG TPA: SRPBCC family protein [Solirubrobacteraceae bacterium]|jgi:uncharacterized protein YndB with AHSA1/START domain